MNGLELAHAILRTALAVVSFLSIALRVLAALTGNRGGPDKSDPPYDDRP